MNPPHNHSGTCTSFVVGEILFILLKSVSRALEAGLSIGLPSMSQAWLQSMPI